MLLLAENASLFAYLALTTITNDLLGSCAKEAALPAAITFNSLPKTLLVEHYLFLAFLVLPCTHNLLGARHPCSKFLAFIIFHLFLFVHLNLITDLKSE